MKNAFYLFMSLWLSTNIFAKAATPATESARSEGGITISPASSMTVSCSTNFFPLFEAWALDFGGARVLSNDCAIDDEVTWEYGPTNYESGCEGSEIYTITFVAINSCSDVISTTASFTIQDNTGPVIEAPPANAVYNCVNAIPAASAYDQCSQISFTETADPYTEDYCNGFAVTYHWEASDACGNTTTLNRTYIVEGDNTPPTFSFVPPDIVTTCQRIPAPEQAWAFDVCSNVDISFSQEVEAGDCAGTSVIHRTWTATDECGNQSEASQRIEVIDNTPPRIFIQHPALAGLENGNVVELECESWDELYYGTSAIFANDDCSIRSDVQYDLQLEHFPTCNADGFFARATSRWIATDECGNASELVLYFLVADHTPPSLFNIPADICAPILPPVPAVTAADNCSEVEIQFVESNPQQGDDGTIYVERRWTAFDECGNTDASVQRITIEDRISPEIRILFPGLEDVPVGGGATLAFDCNGDSLGVPIFKRSDFDVTDNVGVQEVFWEKTLIISGNCPNVNYLHQVVLSVTAIDTCGNFTRISILLTIVDETPPSFSSFSRRLVLACGSPIPALEAVDDCGGPVELSFEDTHLATGSCTGEETAIVRTWTAVDQCGNATSATQEIHLVDNTAPDFVDFTKDTCGLPAPPPADVMVLDECRNEVIPATLSQDTIIGPCGITIRRTYSATDQCGNTSTKVQTIFEADNEPPLISFAHPRLINLLPGQTIEQNCVDFQGEAYPSFGEEAVEVVDNCSDNIEVILIAKLVEEGSCNDEGFLEKYQYTWQAIDPCGNVSELTIFVNAVDISPPIFASEPRDTSIFCESPVPPTSDIIIADGCSEFTVDFTETYHTISPTIEQIRRTWVASDECGNTAEADQRINLIDGDLVGSFTTTDSVICSSSGNSLGIQVSGGVPPYRYHWAVLDSVATITSGQNTANITYSAGASAMVFAVKIMDQSECQITEFVQIGCTREEELLPMTPDQLAATSDHPVHDFILLPNPAAEEGYVEIHSEEGLTARVKVQNIFGSAVFEKKFEVIPTAPVQLPVGDLNSGIYTVTVWIDEKHLRSKQLVIMR